MANWIDYRLTMPRVPSGVVTTKVIQGKDAEVAVLRGIPGGKSTFNSNIAKGELDIRTEIHFVVATNGSFSDRAPSIYVAKFHTNNSNNQGWAVWKKQENAIAAAKRVAKSGLSEEKAFRGFRMQKIPQKAKTRVRLPTSPDGGIYTQT